MNRREFLQAVIVVPVGAYSLYKTKRLFGQNCSRCLPMCLLSINSTSVNNIPVREPTGIELKSFSVRENNPILDFLRGLFNK